MHKIITVLIFLFFWFCIYAQKNNPFAWLKGTWRVAFGDNEIVETWKIVNDSTLQGKSYFVQNKKDSTLEETVELVKKNNRWFYIPTTANQNNGNPILFKIIFHKQNEFIAVNPKHDYPQRIVYRLVNQNLYASIEGKKIRSTIKRILITCK